LTYFGAKFGKSPQRYDLRRFLEDLRKGSRSFAIAEDVRDFVQHQGLPVIDYNRSFSGTSVKLSMTLNAPELSKHARAWRYSKLNPDDGTIDFFNVLTGYYLRMTRDLGNFLAKRFAPDFQEAHHFFSGLAAEVRRQVPRARMIVLTRFRSAENKHNFSFVEYPEDVYRQLGVTVKE
jgi:hypothetical protein